jgi:RNA polymerase sigma-70 factor (ECF subfamily)
MGGVEGVEMDDEDDLIESARNGDLRAFELLVGRHQQSALRVAYAIVPMHAEDVVQEAFVKAYRALPGFQSKAAFRPWVLRIGLIGSGRGRWC